jgi:tRNA threonylcarbamoyl adenosine modification protein (Sua5/YciO/YrdC/YwlC family)
MIIQLHPENPEIRILKEISSKLKEGKVYIFPTDTVYSLIADASSMDGINRIIQIKKLSKNKPLSLLCKDISMASEYVETIPELIFRIMKKHTPGPFVFILKSNKNLSKDLYSHTKNKEIGIRIPDNIYLKELMKVHDSPLTSSSLFSDDMIVTEPEELESIYGKQVEKIIDGGILSTELATVIQAMNDDIVVKRKGKGFEEIEPYGIREE